MKRKTLYLLMGFVFVAIVVLSGLVFKKSNAPYYYATKHSGLSLPKDMILDSFEDNWHNTNGDGHRTIVYKLLPEHLPILTKECLKEGYKKLPITGFYKPIHISDTDEGFYKLHLLSSCGSSFSLVVVNLSKALLYIHLSIT